ncbi:Polygalacturonase [Lachnellula hyalina]|uniref:endo-polygalacturonase n=1 Tax=Lachnellula hyalina TaxID=1316788 RepID=A0A8H8QWG5_9HELO|nr:Polygalacturonase [Lachnellula hyalina]TVY23435.1 Polygalacturonase [Lachnellula hyalina]
MLSLFFISSFLTTALAGGQLERQVYGSPCYCTNYSQIPTAVASCTEILLENIAAPNNSSIDLSKLKDNTKVTFSGLTTFGFTNSSSFEPMIFGGDNVTITAAKGAQIDGNGPAYWDGLGSNGGVPKPNHFITVSKMTGGSVIKLLHIKNWPVHLFSISGSSDLTLRDMILDNSAGDAPNNRSNGLAAGHNSDGFDVSSCNNTLIANTTVINQDDCVAVTSGNNVTVDSMYCSGGHGLSIGSVGGKANNVVTNVLFSNSQIVNSQNGARIKTNYNTTGFIANITYSSISLSNISSYGIDVQQDYLNGGPTGDPSNGVSIENVLFKNVTGTATESAYDYYVLCGSGSCENFVFDEVEVTGGGKGASCNFPAGGCPV